MPARTVSEDFSKGLWKENPVFRQLLGMCPTLAVTNAMINGLAMGSWKARWQPIGEGDPTYVFGVKAVYSNELTVVKRYESPPDASIDGVDMVSYVNVGEVRTDTVTIKSNPKSSTPCLFF